MKKIKQGFKGLSTFDKIYGGIFLAIIIACSIITGQHATLNILGFNMDSFYVSLFASIIGVIYVISVRLANKSSMLLGALFSILYCVLAFSNKNYGDTMVNLYCSIVCLLGFIGWSRNTKNDKKVESRDLTKKQLIVLCGISIVLYVLCLFGLEALGTNNLYIDSAIAVVVIMANTLMSLRYREMWVFYNILNSLHVILWGIRIHEGVPNAMALEIMFACYLINSLIATKQWYKKK